MLRKTVYLSSAQRETVDLCCTQTLQRRKDRLRRVLEFLFRSKMSGIGYF